MGTTLTNGVYLPNEGERNCYAGLKTNWEILDQKVADVTALQQAVAGALHREIVESLPTTDIDPNTIYMILSGTSATENVYNEFMYVNNSWELIGTSATDLTNYYTKGEVDGKLLLKANDNAVVHNSGDETVAGTKTFGNGTLIVDNNTGSNIHGEIKFNGSRPGYIVADHIDDSVFDGTSCGISVLLPDSGKPLHIGSYKTDSNGRVFADNTNKNPILTVMGSLIKTSILIPEGDSGNNAFRILSQLDYANGDTSKVLDVRFQQYDNANATSSIYSYTDNKTTLGATTKRWSGVYSTNYYYGNDNVEFSTKFVTTDTNQTVRGQKTFLSTPIIYNSDTSGYIPNLNFKNQFVTKGETSSSGNQQIVFSDMNSKLLGRVQSAKVSNGTSSLNLRAESIDTSNNDVVVEVQILAGKDGSKSFSPQTGNAIDLGRTLSKWNNIHVNQINSLNPSSISLPDIDNKVDISSYVTDLTGVPNEYTPTVNGWVCVRSANATKISILDKDTGVGTTNISPTATFLGVMVPCIANRKVYINIMCTSLEFAYFIPCQGNV